MKVYLFALLVRRSMYTVVPVTVPRHEADLLRAVHSGDVDLLDEEPVGFFEVGAVYEERDRLRMSPCLRCWRGARPGRRRTRSPRGRR